MFFRILNYKIGSQINLFKIDKPAPFIIINKAYKL